MLLTNKLKYGMFCRIFQWVVTENQKRCSSNHVHSKAFSVLRNKFERLRTERRYSKHGFTNGEHVFVRSSFEQFETVWLDKQHSSDCLFFLVIIFGWSSEATHFGLGRFFVYFFSSMQSIVFLLNVTGSLSTVVNGFPKPYLVFLIL